MRACLPSPLHSKVCEVSGGAESDLLEVSRMQDDMRKCHRGGEEIDEADVKVKQPPHQDSVISKADEKEEETATVSPLDQEKAAAGPGKGTAENESTIDFDLNEL